MVINDKYMIATAIENPLSDLMPSGDDAGAQTSEAGASVEIIDAAEIETIDASGAEINDAALGTSQDSSSSEEKTDTSVESSSASSTEEKTETIVQPSAETSVDAAAGSSSDKNSEASSGAETTNSQEGASSQTSSVNSSADSSEATKDKTSENTGTSTSSEASTAESKEEKKESGSKQENSSETSTGQETKAPSDRSNEAENSFLERQGKSEEGVGTESETGSEHEADNSDQEGEEKGQLQNDEVTQAINTETAIPESDTASRGGGFGVIFAVIAVIVFVAAAAIVIMRIIKGKNSSMDDYERRTQSPENEHGGATVKINKVSKNSPAIITTIHGIGNRPMQQDSFGISEVNDPDVLAKKGILAIVADGMGGLEDGDKISQLVVVTMLQEFDAATGSENPAELLLSLLDKANDAVNDELGSERRGQCGSTLVSVIVRNGSLYYISVGDSHIYLYRDGVLKQINHDHNYAAELDEKARNGEISFDEAALNPKRSALTSYIGMGDLELVDQNTEPMKLTRGDRILLMSDGIYGTVGDENLCHAMDAPLKKSAQMINEIIKAEDRPKQDNYTCILMEIT